MTIEWKYLSDTIQRYQWSRDGLATLDMNPDFQRGHVWTQAQQIAYIEHCLSGGQSGREIYFNCVGWQRSYVGPFVLVDSKQRIEAVLKFLANDLPIFGSHLFNDFTGKISSGSGFFNFNINDLNTWADVLKWYLEMNSGGTPHAKEELSRVEDLLLSEKAAS